MSPFTSFAFGCPLKINCGRHALAHLPAELAALGARSPLVVANRIHVGKGRIRKVLGAFKSSGLIVGLYDGLTDSAQPDLLPGLARMFTDGGCDSLVAVGAGETVETAKQLALTLTHGARQLFDASGRCSVDPGPLVPLMLVATEGGNGYEASGTVQDGQRRLNHQRLMPRAALIDPAMMNTQNKFELSDGAMIALAHAVAAFVNESGGPMGKAWAHTAIQALVGNLPAALRHPQDRRSRCAVVSGQIMAASAWWQAEAEISHRLARHLAELAGLPPGFVLAMLLPHTIPDDDPDRSGRIGRLLLPLGESQGFAVTAEDYKLLRIKALLWEFIDAVNAEIGDRIPTCLDEAGVSEEQIAGVLEEIGDDAAARLIHRARSAAGLNNGNGHGY